MSKENVSKFMSINTSRCKENSCKEIMDILVIPFIEIANTWE